jgi:hypothetical protein
LKEWRCEIDAQSMSILGRSEWIFCCLKIGIHKHGEYTKFGGYIPLVKSVEKICTSIIKPSKENKNIILLMDMCMWTKRLYSSCSVYLFLTLSVWESGDIAPHIRNQ